ncbi:hypothetical protein TNCV_4601871 [Trichonephila clavipes]|nr:hypothetical protein TNCV_4601871 [Trichonephila clavipes]
MMKIGYQGQVGRSDLTVREYWNHNGQEKGMLHGDQALDDFIRPIIKKTVTTTRIHSANFLIFRHSYTYSTFTTGLYVSPVPSHGT